MGRKAKFEKLEKNESYYSLHGDDEKSGKKGFFTRISDAVKSKEREITKLDPTNVPEKKELSSRFTYKKNVKKVIYKEDEEAVVQKPDKAPYVLAFCVMLLMLAARQLFLSETFVSLSEKNAAIAETIASISVYVVPSLCFLLSSKSRKKSHYFKKFSPSMIPFMGAMFGLLLCATALQKYYIAYTFSYSVEYGAATKSIFLLLLTSAVLPAVCEEFFVHGVFQKQVSAYAGGICGVLLSALVFAMLHFELQYFLIYFVAGVAMGSLTHVTGSVLSAMIVHFLCNTFSVLFSDRLSYIAVERIGGTLLMVVLAFLCFVFLIVSLRIAETISFHRAKKQPLFDKDIDVAVSQSGNSLSKTGKAFSNGFVLLCYVVFAVAVLFLQGT